MRYCVLYPNTKNVNLVKEMGMIPYKLHSMFRYDSKIACYNLDEYTYLSNEVSGLKIDFIENKYNNYSLDGMKYLKKEAKNIDILQIFHVTLYSMVYAFTYKALNPKGKVYLKRDCSHKLIDRILSLSSFQKILLNKYLNKVDLISVEQKSLFNRVKELLPKHKSKIINIPNGVDFRYLEERKIEYNYEIKENIILNVARVGTEEKNTEMLLEAFKNITNIEKLGWKLVIIGPIEADFQNYIHKFFIENPTMKSFIEFKGAINDREEIFKYYQKSKIFSLTSRFESFGIAFIEAAALGNVIISTDVGIARELVSDNIGALVKNEDTYELTQKLEEFMKKSDLKEKSSKVYNLCKSNFNWDTIINNLHKSLNDIFL